MINSMPTTIDVEASYATLDDPDAYVQHHEGLRLWKTADDLTRYATIIEATRPEVVVETGTRWGGFAAWLADGFGVEVVTVDVEVTAGRPDEWPGVKYIIGDSIDSRTIERVREAVAGRRVMVSLDSEHASPHVQREILAYGPMVTPGCYLVVEDGIADLVNDKQATRLGHRIPREGGPLRAIRRRLAGRPGWEPDTEIERLSPISHHPAGWWRRTAIS